VSLTLYHPSVYSCTVRGCLPCVTLSGWVDAVDVTQWLHRAGRQAHTRHPTPHTCQPHELLTGCTHSAPIWHGGDLSLA
jgi:hypothetical protein